MTENETVSARAKHWDTHLVTPPGLAPNGNHPGTTQTPPMKRPDEVGAKSLFGIQAPKLET